MNLQEGEIKALITKKIMYCNFSSPHEFTLDTNQVIPGYDKEFAQHYSVSIQEIDAEDGDIKLLFSIPSQVIKRMEMFMDIYKEVKPHQEKRLIVYVPLMMMNALKEQGFDIKNSPFRTIRRVERGSNIVSSTKFCI